MSSAGPGSLNIEATFSADEQITLSRDAITLVRSVALRMAEVHGLEVSIGSHNVTMTLPGVFAASPLHRQTVVIVDMANQFSSVPDVTIPESSPPLTDQASQDSAPKRGKARRGSEQRDAAVRAHR